MMLVYGCHYICLKDGEFYLFCIINLLFHEFLSYLFFYFVGLFARDVSVLHRVGHVLLQAPTLGPKRKRRFIVADDCFQLSRVPKEKTVHVLSKAIESLSGCKYSSSCFKAQR